MLWQDRVAQGKTTIEEDYSVNGHDHSRESVV
jgi:hypothetical protein